MAEDELIAAYVQSLSVHLRGFWPQRARVLEEVHAHLEDAAESVGAVAAIERFGPVPVVARRFADQRLAAAVQLALPVMVVGLAVLAACGWLEAAFPVAPVFRVEAPPPMPSVVVAGCQVLQWLTWPLLGLAALAVRQRSAQAASNAVIAAVVTAIVGFSGTAFIRLLTSMSRVGAASPAPLLIRVVVIVALFAALSPLLLAHDATSATTRALDE
jgi:hypothetical protein